MAKSRILKLAAVSALLLCCAYSAAAGYMYLNQRSFVFKPSDALDTPADKGLDQITIETAAMADGTEVLVWTAAPTLEGAPTVLYFHGNAGNVSRRHKRFREVLESGFGLYAPSYRGYPGSAGGPSEAGFIADALEHFDRLEKAGSKIVVHGESLGTGVATAVGLERSPLAVVLEAPYTALSDMARAQYPWLPVDLLMKDPFVTRDRLPEIGDPVLIVHGRKDRVIPFEHGKFLYDVANAPKHFVDYPDATHSNLWPSGLWSEVLKFLDREGLWTGK